MEKHRWDSAVADKEDSSPGRTAKEIFDWVEILVVLLSLVMIVITFFCRAAAVSGSSMEGTLSDGDLVIFSGLFYEPKQGDIVVFDPDSDAFTHPLVKRVIATEGQTLDIDPHSGGITVDGILLNEPYVEDTAEYDASAFPYTVEEGRVFLLGDNRNNSVDSRSDMIGTVSVKNILGRVILRFYPIRSFGIPE
ncbi:MAG: signal peptidase I [Clostridia bacterium]|nr:signal peptidase I [Clostridia bacterium]